jgi:hypothetical protein
MTTQKKLSPIELYTLCFAVISDPNNWTKNTAARNAKGFPVSSRDEKAVCWCSAGVINLFCKDRHPLTYMQAKWVLESALDIAAHQLDSKLNTRVRKFISYNDKMKHEDTLVMWREARVLLQARSDKGLL